MTAPVRAFSCPEHRKAIRENLSKPLRVPTRAPACRPIVRARGQLSAEGVANWPPEDAGARSPPETPSRLAASAASEPRAAEISRRRLLLSAD